MPEKFIEIAVVWLYILCIHSAYCKIWGQIWPAHMEGWSQDTWCELTDFDDFFFSLLNTLYSAVFARRSPEDEPDRNPAGRYSTCG